jgi:hypothetical protein
LAFVAFGISFEARPQAPELLSCDDAVARQDFVVTEALTRLDGESILIVVLRPSAGEKSNLIRAKRLYNLQQYFKDRGKRLPADRFVIAVGPPVSGLARIEYYLDGKLFEKINFPRNGFVCHRCCGPDPAYYPDKKAPTRRGELR